MLDSLIANWWMLLVRGLCAILFGAMAFAWPGLTLFVLIVFYAVHAIIDGVAAFVVGWQMRRMSSDTPWLPLILVGLVSVVAGTLAIAWPGLTAVALLYVLAGWAIARGIFEILVAIRLRKVIENEFFLALAGLASILFGIILIARPGAGILSMIWLVGTFAIAFGVLQVILAFRLRGLGQRRKAALDS